jgi:cytosine/adenosine deaminase-related metal-dependent hydrolase
MASNSILLQGGTILVHGNDDHIKSVKADLLIEGSIITKIEAGIKPSSETQVLNCTDKIISPGFIDTHHHVWQTLQKGRHANELLLSYMASGISPFFFKSSN